jgi:hypothetical protein
MSRGIGLDLLTEEQVQTLAGLGCTRYSYLLALHMV